LKIFIPSEAVTAINPEAGLARATNSQNKHLKDRTLGMDQDFNFTVSLRSPISHNTYALT
jgi:hypothetical protein